MKMEEKSPVLHMKELYELMCQEYLGNKQMYDNYMPEDQNSEEHLFQIIVKALKDQREK